MWGYRRIDGNMSAFFSGKRTAVSAVVSKSGVERHCCFFENSFASIESCGRGSACVGIASCLQQC